MEEFKRRMGINTALPPMGRPGTASEAGKLRMCLHANSLIITALWRMTLPCSVRSANWVIGESLHIIM